MNAGHDRGISSPAQPDLLVEVGGREHVAVEVADAELGATAADRAGQHDADVLVEPQPYRRAPAGRAGPVLVGALDDET